MYVSDVPVPADAFVEDLRLAARGLGELLHARLLHAPAAPAARALLVLLEHLQQHYRRPALFRYHPDIRAKVRYTPADHLFVYLGKHTIIYVQNSLTYIYRLSLSSIIKLNIKRYSCR